MFFQEARGGLIRLGDQIRSFYNSWNLIKEDYFSTSDAEIWKDDSLPQNLTVLEAYRSQLCNFRDNLDAEIQVITEQILRLEKGRYGQEE